MGALSLVSFSVLFVVLCLVISCKITFLCTFSSTFSISFWGTLLKVLGYFLEYFFEQFPAIVVFGVIFLVLFSHFRSSFSYLTLRGHDRDFSVAGLLDQTGCKETESSYVNFHQILQVWLSKILCTSPVLQKVPSNSSFSCNSECHEYE